MIPTMKNQRRLSVNTWQDPLDDVTLQGAAVGTTPDVLADSGNSLLAGCSTDRTSDANTTPQAGWFFHRRCGRDGTSEHMHHHHVFVFSAVSRQTSLCAHARL